MGTGSVVPAPNGTFEVRADRRRRSAARPGSRCRRRRRSSNFGGCLSSNSQWAIQITLSNPYTYRASTLTAGHRAVHRRRDHRVHRVGRRGGVPRPAVHDAAPPADDRGPRPRAGRARQPGPDPARRHRGDRDLRAVAPVQRDGRPARGERRRSSGATATGAATSWPTCRTSCARRSPHCGCRTSS